MRFSLLVSLFTLGGLIVPLSAQDKSPVAEAASRELIAEAFKALGVEAARERDVYTYEFKGRSFTLERLDEGEKVLLKTSIKEQPSLAVLNRYNEVIAVTTRAVRYEKTGTVLETGLDCRLGVTATGLKKFMTYFVDDVAEFESFLAKQKDRKPADSKKDGAP